jgi:hypothetical protein
VTAETAQHDQEIADQLERELPGFWAYFAARHPKFGLSPDNKVGPIGWMPAEEVYEVIGDTITAYVREFGN